EADGAGGRQLGRRRQIGRPAFEDDGAADGALERSTHPLPGDRWPGVQNGLVSAQKRNGLQRRYDIDQHRLGRQQTPARLLVGGIDAWIAEEPCQQLAQTGDGAGRWLPVDVRHRYAATRQIGGELRQANVDDAERRGQQTGRCWLSHAVAPILSSTTPPCLYYQGGRHPHRNRFGCGWRPRGPGPPTQV